MPEIDFLPSRSLSNLLALCVLALAVGLATLSITPSWPSKDGAEYTRLAYFLAEEGIFSNGDIGSGGTLQPSMIREPGLPMLYAVAMKITGPEVDAIQCAEYSPSGDLVRLTWGNHLAGCARALAATRWVNVLTLLALGLLSYFCTRAMLPGAPSRLLFLSAMCLGAFHSRDITSNYAELLAATLALAATIGMHAALFTERHITLKALAAGIALGALILTKAVFYYVGPPIAFLFVTQLAVRRDFAKLPAMILILVTAYALVTPWVNRNETLFGDGAIATTRNVLAIRAEYNQLTLEQWLSGFVRYSPWVRANEVGGLGEQEDLSDPMSRENPDGYYKRAMERRGRAAELAGGSEADLSAINAAAKKLIRGEPGRHAATTVLFGYRGAFSYFDRSYDAVRRTSWTASHLIAQATMMLAWAATFFSLGTFVWACITGDFETLVILVCGVFCFAIHAAATHFIPRYLDPALPSFVLLLVMRVSVWISQRTSPIPGFRPRNRPSS